MAHLKEIEFFIVIDSDGDFVVSKREADAREAYVEDIDGDEGPKHVIRVRAKAPVPEVIDGGEVEIPNVAVGRVEAADL